MKPASSKVKPASAEMQPVFLVVATSPYLSIKVVRKPISNKIIKIGSRTVCFSLIFRAFFDLPVLRHKRETVKN
jgi:hypothetical protein